MKSPAKTILVYRIAAVAGGAVCALVVSVLLTFPLKWVLAGILGLVLCVSAIACGNPSRFFLVMLALAVPVAASSHTFFKQEEYSGFATAGVAFGVVDVALLALYVPWLLRLASGRARPIIWRSAPNVLALGFLACSFLSLVNAPDKDLAIFEALRMVKGYSIFFYMSNAVEPEDLPYIAGALLVGAAAQSGIGVAQYLSGSSLGLGILGEPEGNLPLVLGGREYARVAGTIHHPNQYALYLSFLLSFAFSLLLSLRRNAWARIGCGVVFIAGLAALILTFSRTGWISAGVACSSVFVAAVLLGRVTRRQILGLMVIGGIGFLVALSFSAKIVERLVASDPQAVVARIELLRVAWEMIREHPLIGVGLNNFVRVLQDWDPIGVSFVRNVHNLYALIWAETGLFALLAFLGVTVSVLHASFRPIRSERPLWHGIALGIGGGLVGFLVDGLADYSYRLDVTHTLFWFFAGLVLALSRLCASGDVPGRAGDMPCPAIGMSPGAPA